MLSTKSLVSGNFGQKKMKKTWLGEKQKFSQKIQSRSCCGKTKFCQKSFGKKNLVENLGCEKN